MYYKQMKFMSLPFLRSYFFKLIARNSNFGNQQSAGMALEPSSNSQAGQESFVLAILEGKIGGFYLEIGAYDPVVGSNTKVLESKYGWNGISLEIDKTKYLYFQKNRRNPVFNLDATKCQYNSLLKSSGAPNRIDFLQLDIEPAKNTFKSLLRVMKSGYSFSVITYEHDVYASKKNYAVKWLAFIILWLRGYKRMGNDICEQGKPFEDWYVNRDLRLKSKLKSRRNWEEHFVKI